jgi:hypothetical protein
MVATTASQTFNQHTADATADADHSTNHEPTTTKSPAETKQ